MNDLELRTRRAMTVLADQAVPTDLLARLDRLPVRRGPQPAVRRWALVAAVVAAAVLIALGVVLRSPGSHAFQPVVDPPKVIRLAAGADAAPGKALMEVTLAPTAADREPATFVVVAGSDEAVRLPMSSWAPVSYTRHLSQDGTRLLLQNDSESRPAVEIVHLRTGTRQRVGNAFGYCPRLSPDHRTIAMWKPDEDADPLVLLDVASGAVRPGPIGAHPSKSSSQSCTDLAWSPAGGRLATPTGDALGTVVADLRRGTTVQLAKRSAVNGGQSWSPDGKRILLYARAEGRFVVHTLATGEETSLGGIRIAMAPVGWAGSRVVWLAGSPGDQRLVTTDEHGGDEQLWTRFDVGDRAVQSISWSAELAGRAG